MFVDIIERVPNIFIQTNCIDLVITFSIDMNDALSIITVVYVTVMLNIYIYIYS